MGIERSSRASVMPLRHVAASRHCNTAQIESLHAPTGGGVELPCDVTPALEDDSLALVIWYKQGHDAPIYSLNHWIRASENTLKLRAFIPVNTSVATAASPPPYRAATEN
ncbi:hypothetical protein EVAR_55153_1 [Eumeta japonica]|uniref:Ig-like domain-containing protein n=1 Tax=Eumeta variegata TaxID=151549 RepID=A0A4C1YAQ2_EUMVA|nr:hypothetical protein EVAR_55153_1 [Eumeta japonica]